MRAVLVVVLLILVLAGGVLAWRSNTGAPPEAAAPAAKESLYLAIPQGIYVPMARVMSEYERTHPNVEFQLTVDTPEAMVELVEENETKPDVFISPGGHEAEVLRERGYLDPSTMVAFGSYELAILVPKGNPGKIEKLEDLLNPEVKVISFSNPEVNAACYAARQSFRNLGLWERVEKKIQITGCCMESFKWILDGRAEANVQFLGCPIDPKTEDIASKSKVEIACTFPADSFYVPRNVAGILTTSKKRQLAEEFLGFMTSPDMVALMAENKMRNDQGLPLTPGPWGPEHELGPSRQAAP